MRNVVGAIALGVLVTGCATATPAQKGAVTGSAIGAGLGAIIGHQSGETAEGALIGAAAGGLAGALVGDAMASQFCRACGSRYLSANIDGTICPRDGTPLSPIGVPPKTAEEQQVQATHAYFCPTCGSTAAKEGYCPDDGTKLKARPS